MNTPGPIRVLIVDDEPRARRGVQLMLARQEGFAVVGEATCGEAAIEMVRTLHPDLVFLDVQMPGLDGFATLARLTREEMPVVVFVTAYDQYAVKAFDFHAIDYLLKPVDEERFGATIERVREQVRLRKAEDLQARLLALLGTVAPGAANPPAAVAAAPVPPPAAAERPDRIVIKDGAEVIILRPVEVDWIEADGDYMKFHVGPKSYLQRETMNALEARLDAARFRRIHRSTIVNLDRIARLSPSFNGDHVVVLKDGTRLRLSKGYQDRLQEWLRQVG